MFIPSFIYSIPTICQPLYQGIRPWVYNGKQSRQDLSPNWAHDDTDINKIKHINM